MHGMAFAQPELAMRARPTSAQTLSACLVAVLALPGCYLAHGLGGGAPRDSGVVAIDGPLAPDAFVARDASPPMPDVASTCAPRGPGVAVRVEPVTTETSVCLANHVEGMRVDGIEPAPDDLGVRIHADFCPGRDLDCRCDIVISNIGADVAPTELLLTELTLDLNPGTGLGTFISITQMPRCRCDGCTCSLELVLYAGDLEPTSAPFMPRELSFARGTELCPDLGCISGTWALAVGPPESDIELREGDTATSGVIHVRSVRDLDIFGPCAACGMCGTLHGGWVAWAQ